MPYQKNYKVQSFKEFHKAPNSHSRKRHKQEIEPKQTEEELKVKVFLPSVIFAFLYYILGQKGYSTAWVPAVWVLESIYMTVVQYLDNNE